MRRFAYLLLMVVILAGCKSSKHVVVEKEKVAVTPTFSYLASKLQLTIPSKSGSMSVGGIMKMKSNELVQISLLMPILRTEIARIEIAPDKVLIVDRMNKRYVRATKDELKYILPKNAEFKNVEVMYKNEARLGDTMKLYYGEKDDAIFITMKNSIDDKLHCIVKLY